MVSYWYLFHASVNNWMSLRRDIIYHGQNFLQAVCVLLMSTINVLKFHMKLSHYIVIDLQFNQYQTLFTVHYFSFCYYNEMLTNRFDSYLQIVFSNATTFGTKKPQDFPNWIVSKISCEQIMQKIADTFFVLDDEEESKPSYTAASWGILPSSMMCTITDEDVSVEGAQV